MFSLAMPRAAIHRRQGSVFNCVGFGNRILNADLFEVLYFFFFHSPLIQRVWIRGIMMTTVLMAPECYRLRPLLCMWRMGVGGGGDQTDDTFMRSSRARRRAQ